MLRKTKALSNLQHKQITTFPNCQLPVPSRYLRITTQTFLNSPKMSLVKSPNSSRTSRIKVTEVWQPRLGRCKFSITTKTSISCWISRTVSARFPWRTKPKSSLALPRASTGNSKTLPKHLKWNWSNSNPWNFMVSRQVDRSPIPNMWTTLTGINSLTIPRNLLSTCKEPLRIPSPKKITTKWNLYSRIWVLKMTTQPLITIGLRVLSQI